MMESSPGPAMKPGGNTNAMPGPGATSTPPATPTGGNSIATFTRHNGMAFGDFTQARTAT
jgi:hypothetical protein